MLTYFSEILHTSNSIRDQDWVHCRTNTNNQQWMGEQREHILFDPFFQKASNIPQHNTHTNICGQFRLHTFHQEPSWAAAIAMGWNNLTHNTTQAQNVDRWKCMCACFESISSFVYCSTFHVYISSMSMVQEAHYMIRW